MIKKVLWNNRQARPYHISILIITSVVAILLATMLFGIKSTFADAIHYTINYDSSVVNNMPTDTDSESYSETVPISATAPTRSSFRFLGWCTILPTSSGDNNLDICSGTTFASNSDWTIDQTSATNNLHLYAMWQRLPYMQEMNSTKLGALLPNVGSTTTLYDKRDDQSYVVAKLADNKYWMVENLNLAGGTPLSSDDTDVTSGYVTSFVTSNNLTKNGNTIVLPSSSTTGFDINNYSYVYNTENRTSNCTSPGCYSYYSWDAVTLGSGRSISTINTDASQSICPKNWKLPNTRTDTSSVSSDFRNLMIAYGGSRSIVNYDTSTNPTGATMYSYLGPNTVPNFLLTGAYSSNSPVETNTRGGYWSSTSAGDNNGAYGLVSDSTIVRSSWYIYRSRGYAVRCLFSGQ